MECLYKTTTKYTLEEYKKFNNAILMKRHTLLLLLAGLVFILLGGIILRSEFLIIFAIIYPFFFIIIKNSSVKKVFNSNKLTQNVDVTFEFYEDHFEENHEAGQAKIPYEKLHEIIETKTNFYLMIAKNQGYMLAKENMPEGLEEFIRTKSKV
ncbi:MAG: YcxB family protein [Clostridia bacterium]|nr:YcxB family protein [Clostridia bacterium]